VQSEKTYFDNIEQGAVDYFCHVLYRKKRQQIFFLSVIKHSNIFLKSSDE